MLKTTDVEQILQLIHQEVVPSIGCTEPAAVSLCVAKATETLGTPPLKVKILLSANVLKNAMGVGIPGTGMVGLPIAVALGALAGKSEYGLEVLKDINKQDVEQGKIYIDEDRIDIELKKDNTEMLYIEAICSNATDTATAIIRTTHTHFSYIALNDTIHFSEKVAGENNAEVIDYPLTFRKVYDFAMQCEIEDIRFIQESARINNEASIYSAQQNHGHNVGKTIRGALGQKIFGDTILSHMLSHTALACDARMGGAMVPIMSNSGSGNQGIAATLPIVSYAKDIEADEERIIRALALSHLTVIYLKQKLGRLSALCGCVAASSGSACGITYLMGGNYEQLSHTVKNMIANITGMLCDGAKPSCALKIATGVSTAALSAVMAMENQVVTSIEGIVDESVDQTVNNMVRIAVEGMRKTDAIVLDIMTSK